MSRKIVVFSWDEQKQIEMPQEYSASEYPQFRIFIGDVRNEVRVGSALKSIECEFHATAMTHVPIVKCNPMESVKTNIMGEFAKVDFEKGNALSLSKIKN